MDIAQATFNSGLEKAVQGIIQDQDTTPTAFERIFLDKAKILKATVKELFHEIDTRLNLSRNTFQDIDKNIIECHNFLEEIFVRCRNEYFPDNTLAFMPRRMHLENLVFDLEKQKRAEALECWRDIMFLKKYLMSAWSEYWTLKHRSELLSSDLATEIENVQP